MTTEQQIEEGIERLAPTQARLFACDCAERALELERARGTRSWDAIEVSRAYARGEASEEELDDACASVDTPHAANPTASHGCALAVFYATSGDLTGAALYAAHSVANTADSLPSASPYAGVDAFEAEREWQLERLNWYLDGCPEAHLPAVQKPIRSFSRRSPLATPKTDTDAWRRKHQGDGA